jgi:hypothetical protein
MLKMDPVAGVGSLLELHAGRVQEGACGTDSSFDALKSRDQLWVRSLARVVEEPTSNEATVAFEDNVLALFLDDCPRLGGIKTVFGDTFRQGNDLWPEFPQ